MYGLILDWINPSNIKNTKYNTVNNGPIIFISIVVLLFLVKLLFMYRQKQKTWDKLNPGVVVHYLYVNPYSGTGSTHKTEVVQREGNKVELTHIGWLTKKEFFNGKDNLEFLYL